VNGSIANRQPIPAVNVTPATVKVEPVPVKVERGVKIERDTTSSGPTGQNVFSSGPPVITSSGYLTTSTQVGQQSSLGLLMSATSQPLANIQGAVSMGQQVPRMNPGNLSGAQMLHGGANVNQNVMNSLGQSGVSSGTGAMMIPTPGMPQQVQSGMQPLVNNAAATNMPISQQTTSAQPPKYIKAWEGTLTGLRQGQPVFISKLEGYRSFSASETLTADWPVGMQIGRLIPQEHMNNKQYVGKADFLVFRAMNQHGFLGQLKEKKQCAVIQLPSQTLLLSVSDKPSRLIGMIFPKDVVVTKPPLSSQQQQQQQMQQQRQQMQSQQQQLSHMQMQQLSQHQQLPQQQQMVGSGVGQKTMLKILGAHKRLLRDKFHHKELQTMVEEIS
jgi:mediator of RNA polymerase II transcription subunit 25